MNAYSERIFVLSLLSCVFSRTFLSGGIGAPIFSAFSRILPRVYLKSRNYRLFLQAQPDYALKSLGIRKGFLRLFALHPACVCEISVIFFVFRYTLICNAGTSGKCAQLWNHADLITAECCGGKVAITAHQQAAVIVNAKHRSPARFAAVGD